MIGFIDITVLKAFGGLLRYYPIYCIKISLFLAKIKYIFTVSIWWNEYREKNSACFSLFSFLYKFYVSHHFVQNQNKHKIEWTEQKCSLNKNQNRWVLFAWMKWFDCKFSSTFPFVTYTIYLFKNVLWILCKTFCGFFCYKTHPPNVNTQ